MILTTLEKIESFNPCDDYDVLKKHLNIPLTEEFCISRFFEVEGTEHHNVSNCLWFLWQTKKPEHRKIINEFSYWCANSVRHLMEDVRSTECLDATRKYLDGNASKEELMTASYAATTYATTYAATYAVADADAYAAAAAVADAVAASYASYAAADAADAAYAATAAAAAYAATAAAAAAAADAGLHREKQIEKLLQCIEAGEWVDD